MVKACDMYLFFSFIGRFVFQNAAVRDEMLPKEGLIHAVVDVAFGDSHNLRKYFQDIQDPKRHLSTLNIKSISPMSMSPK